METIDVQTEIKMHGYEEVPAVIVPNQNLICFASFIEDLEIEKKSFRLGPSTKEAAIRGAKNFFNHKFKLNKVPYKSDFRTKLDVPLLRYLPGQEIPLRVHNSFIRQINPFKLPLRFTSENLTECMVVENATFILNDDFLSRMKISYREIILPSEITELTESSYVHEITHTQLAHRKGIIKNFFNREVLSIFLELLNIADSSPKLLPLQDAVRLTELYQGIYTLEEQHHKVKSYSEEDLLDISVYTESILKAFGLFAEYYYGPAYLKKYILTSIQNIFNGDLQLEELLDEFELTINRVTTDETLKKYLTR